MRRNIDALHGLILSEAVMLRLGESVGRQVAHDIVYEAAMAAFEQRRPLRDLLLADERVMARLSPAQVDDLLRPEGSPDDRDLRKSGIPAVERVLSSRMRPPRMIDSPEATTTVVFAARWLMSGLAPATDACSGTLTSWFTSTVTCPPELMRGVTVSRIPVSMYWKLLMGIPVSLPAR